MSTRQNAILEQSIGIKIYPRTAPITAQAVGGVLIQALTSAWNRYGLVPNALLDSFTYFQASSEFFNVEVTIAAVRNLSNTQYRFTNDHAVTTLSLLGYEFSNQPNMSNLVEYDFDVVVDQWLKPEVVIAKGSVSNAPSDQNVEDSSSP